MALVCIELLFSERILWFIAVPPPVNRLCVSVKIVHAHKKINFHRAVSFLELSAK